MERSLLEGSPSKLNVLGGGRQDTLNSTFHGYIGCREYFCGRLDWAVACGAEQECGHVLCVHVLGGMPLPCQGYSQVAGVCGAGWPILPPQPVPSDQVAVSTEPPSHPSLKPST